ncbi:L-rhamnose mutarotase [Dyadobacter sp. CY323]|uniref:L-rhamnose mutarotase n=1 Tax=Dyadobacter sp. CY323 TaxID=2907302 RepID=UPI001F1C725F|nr:L-rhamnose mutarotase [Dyadobacter sp. CY323]MCE6990193.1 L-rhamnose mutarotase [Dyadobacter sp. CY323]
MIRKAFLITAKPGLSMEYQKRHNPIWPELEQTLKDHGVSNYSIFLHEATHSLFGYLEVADEELFLRIAETEVCQRWWKYMTEVLICEEGNAAKAQEDMLSEVFHLD